AARCCSRRHSSSACTEHAILLVPGDPPRERSVSSSVSYFCTAPERGAPWCAGLLALREGSLRAAVVELHHERLLAVLHLVRRVRELVVADDLDLVARAHLDPPRVVRLAERVRLALLVLDAGAEHDARAHAVDPDAGVLL